jgi:RimJ/RimL family protein N-acetyltransferase
VDELQIQIARREGRLSPDGEEIWLNWTMRFNSAAVVGCVQAGVKRRRADLAWLVGLPFQRRGYATEAMIAVGTWLSNRLNVRELRAHIHPDHHVSQAIARHLGLIATGEMTDDGEEVWSLSISR